MADEPGQVLAVPDAATAVIDGVPVAETAAGADRPAPAVSPRARRVARLIVRHAAYIAAGAIVAGRRWHARRTRHERVQRALEAQGNHEAMLSWRQQQELEHKQRAERWEARIRVAIDVAKATPWILGSVVVAPGVLGICVAFWRHDPLDVVEPYFWAGRVIALAADVVLVALPVGMAAVPAGVLGRLYYLGRTAGELAPRWAVAGRPEADGRGLVVTADTIVLALQHVPVTPLKKAMNDGWKPTFTLTPVKDGRGYSATFSLPLGVTPDMVADQRAILARNLHRDEIEVWPSAGPPGHASLWVADPGAISKAAPEYPLMHEGQADVFAGVPGGVIARGDGVLIPVVGNNGVFGGMMGQGKSNAMRVLALGCATDPLCGLDVFVFANNGDFDAYEPRLNNYRKGLDDDVIVAALDELHEAYRDVGEREMMLADIGAKKVTRAVAEKYPELRPRVSFFSECHELFGHPEYGELAGELAVKTAKRARKTARVLEFDTQSSRKAAIPPALVELVSVNACFAVKSWRSNDGFLGDGSFAAGIRATELRPGRDRGTSLVTGISDAQFELLRWYFIEVNDDTGFDAAAEVIARCMAAVAPGTPVGGSAAPAIEAPRDLLADVAAVTGPDRVNVNDLPALLRELAPRWPAYKALNGTQLRQLLNEAGVRTTNPGNRPQLDPSEVRRVLAERGELAVACIRALRSGVPGEASPTVANRSNTANFPQFRGDISDRSGACSKANAPSAT